MRFKIRRASQRLNASDPPCPEAILVKKNQWGSNWEIEINTLDELVEFSKREGQITFDPESIWIYDDYME